MKLKELIFPSQDHTNELYYRGSYELLPQDTLSFDTYFGSLSYTKYLKYTYVKSVIFCCEIQGEATLELCHYDGKDTVIKKAQINNNAELEIDITTLPEKGFIYPKITAITPCKFIGGYYKTENASQNETSMAIAICTYKRENYVLNNIKKLNDASLSLIKRVFVVDNGNTLDKNELSNDFVNILPNKNYGGSGGFSRGLIEALDGGFSHVILMDDDIDIHPEVIEEMSVFMSLLRDEFKNAWFSAAMLPLDKDYEQFELGAEWNGKESIIHKHKVDIREKSVLLDNLYNDGVEYGGWWTICMPTSFIKEKGMPYPFFIKFDDVEYGLRREQGTQIITSNGIAIRHEAFDKKSSFVLDYYNLRNELVVNSVYNKIGTFGIIKRYMREVMKQLTLYRYENVTLVRRAARDYLKGANFFLNTNEEELNKELISKAIKLKPLDEIKEWTPELKNDDMVRNNKVSFLMAITLAGHLIPWFCLKRETLGAPLSKIGAKNIFRRKRVVQYQLGANTGAITKRSFFKFIKHLTLSIGPLLKLLFLSRRAKKSYQKNKDKLTSIDFWREHLEIDVKKEN